MKSDNKEDSENIKNEFLENCLYIQNSNTFAALSNLFIFICGIFFKKNTS